MIHKDIHHCGFKINVGKFTFCCFAHMIAVVIVLYSNNTSNLDNSMMNISSVNGLATTTQMTIVAKYKCTIATTDSQQQGERKTRIRNEKQPN